MFTVAPEGAFATVHSTSTDVVPETKAFPLKGAVILTSGFVFTDGEYVPIGKGLSTVALVAPFSKALTPL